MRHKDHALTGHFDSVTSWMNLEKIAVDACDGVAMIAIEISVARIGTGAVAVTIGTAVIVATVGIVTTTINGLTRVGGTSGPTTAGGDHLATAMTIGGLTRDGGTIGPMIGTGTECDGHVTGTIRGGGGATIPV